MKRYSMFALSKEESLCLMYDYNTDEYMVYDEQLAGRNSYKLFIIQPFIIFAMEELADYLMKVHVQYRFFIGLLVFAATAIIISVLLERYMYHYGEGMKEQSEKIPEPPQESLEEWAGDMVERSRTACRVTGILAAVTAALLIFFMKTGTAVLLLFAMCVYFVTYFIWLAARPDLQRKYIKEIHDRKTA